MSLKYRRLLLVAELGTDPSAALAALRAVAPEAEELRVLTHVPGPRFPWIAGGAVDAAPLVQQLRDAAASAVAGAASVELVLASELDADRIASLAAAARVDLLVVEPRRPAILSLAVEVRKRLSIPILCAGSGAPRQGPSTDVLCIAVGTRERGAVAAFLRDRGGPHLRARVLARPPRRAGDLHAALDIAGIGARVTLGGPRGSRKRIDLLVLARYPGRLLGTVPRPFPVLILPPLPTPTPPRRTIDVPDLVPVDGVLRARLLYASGPGPRPPIADQEIGFVARGAVAAVAATEFGYTEIPGDISADAVGVFRVSRQGHRDPVAAVEARVRVIRPGPAPLILFDAELGSRGLGALGALGKEREVDLLAVRLRPTRGCRAIRARLKRAGLSATVVDASAALDEGIALDVGDELDGVRLARVAARMRGAGGFPVAAIVFRGASRPHTVGFAALASDEVGGWPAPAPAAALATSLAARLEATTGAAPIPGNRVEVELDNATARRWLLEGIAAARDRVHLQAYMAADDDIGRRVEGALAAAGERGVQVRVVVDSLHGLEGSLGAHNPLLERLRDRPGVELRVQRPITGVPSLEDLKRRDHRKLAVVDGTLGLLGGRNLSHEYYTGFDEVTLMPESLWRQVPWLDAGARVEGPAVAALERSFLGAWVEAGGAPYRVDVPAPAGTTPVRVVVHQGLRDARTLEAYLALIESARSCVVTVNGFPMALEIQHALLRALRRGVRVRCLVGSLTPTHGGTPFRGPWSTARMGATAFVHSRIDAIVAAGGEGYQFQVPSQPGWDRRVGVVCPHVHAKLLCVDGQVCTVGSANLDITAGYWESELMLMVEDPALVGAVEAWVDRLIAGSRRFDRGDPAWQQSARRREWMRHWPGVLSI